MDNQKIINALKEHSPELMDKHTEEGVDALLTLVDVVADEVITMSNIIVDFCNTLANDPELNQLLDV